MIKSMGGKILTHSEDVYASHSIQELLLTQLSNSNTQLIMKEVEGHILELSLDQYGCYVA